MCARIGVIGLFFLSPFLFTDRLDVFAAVVINEIYPKPAAPSESMEWIELYNNGPESVSLDRWTLENSTGEKKTFILNASAIIAPNGFLTFPKSQTGLNLHDEGDTVRLSDVNNNVVDSQSYPSILGYSTSVGRSTDGSGSWVICTTPATYNKPNNCPPPAPTPTPLPTSTPTPNPTPTPTSTPTPTQPPTPTGKGVSPLAQSEVLGEANTPIFPPATAPTTPATDFIQAREYRNYWIVGLLLALLGLLALGASFYKTYKKRHDK